LSDSTVLRNLGVAFSYTLQAVASIEKGLSRVEVNQKRLEDELE
jgi:adenylosuccinate lyase